MTPHESFRNDRMQWIPTMFLSVALFGLCIHYILHILLQQYNIQKISCPMHMDMAGVQLSALIYVAKKLFYGLFGSCLLLLWSTFHCQLFCVVCCSDEHILFQASQLVLLFNTINWTMTRIKNAPNFLRPPLNRNGTRSRIY